MKKNMGNTDKVIRIILALVIAAAYFTGLISGTMAVAALLVGAIFLVTSIVGFCPLYLPFGISTCRK